MMMMGEGDRQNPTVHVPPWASSFDVPTAGILYALPVSGVIGGGSCGDCSPCFLSESALAALKRYLPCNNDEGPLADEDSDESDAPVDSYSCDEFRMYVFKVRRCARGRSHDWTECPYAHPGEKARRRDPRMYHYSGTACPDFRKGTCKRGEACELAHGVFECWLHPARYRTQHCKDGTACRRRVCFFAHTPEQLRVLPQNEQNSTKSASAIESYDASPVRQQELESFLAKSLMSESPTSTLISPPISPPSESPPMSPNSTMLRRASWPARSSMNEIVESMRQLQLSKVKSVQSPWGLHLAKAGFGSPRGLGSGFVSRFCSLPSTPTRTAAVMGSSGWLDSLEGCFGEEEPAVERVESGRALRAKMFEKLSKETVGRKPAASPVMTAPVPDVAWVSELVRN